MKCENCGFEIDDNAIFCPQCGTEVTFVPEFVPEVELSIEESIQGIVSEITEDEDDYIGGEAANFRGESSEIGDLMLDPGEDSSEDSFSKNIPPMFKLIYGAVLGLLLLGLLIFLIVMIYRDNSDRYQAGKGDAAYDARNYKQAVSFYEKALDIEPEMVDYRYKLADCYVAMDNKDMAIEVYKDLIVYDPESTLAYSQVIALYEESDAYDEIDDFLQHYANDKTREAFVDYLAYPPVFSNESGSYDEAVTLTLTSETKGTIYYTDDGSVPSESSTVYTDPIMLKKGKHVIQAFFKNEYGVCSSIETCEYDILAEAPSEPEISLESGDYDTPQLIIINVPEGCRVYYTLDESTPDMNSRIYGEPIPVSDGVTYFKCIAYNSDNVASDVVEREYHISVTTAFTPEMGLGMLNQHLADIGYIKDSTGATEAYPGNFIYMYSDMRYISGRSLYCYNEYYILGTGVKSMTSNVFGIDVITGEVFLVKKGSGDSYSINPF